MKIRNVIIIIGMIVVAVFVALNWSVIMMPTSLSFGIATVQAPLGFMMLTLITTFTTMFLLLVLYTKTSWSSKTQNQFDEMPVSKELVKKAEKSQITELQILLSNGLKQQTDLCVNSKATLMLRIEQLENNLHTLIGLKCNN